MDNVARQAQRLRKACTKSNPEWSELSLAVTELADAVERLNKRSHSEAVYDHLLPLTGEFEELLRNLRSKLVSDVCEQLGRIVKTTRGAFSPLANALLDALSSTAKASSVAIRNPGFQLFSDISEFSRYDLQAINRVYRTSPQERVKALLLDQLHIVLTCWPKRDIEPYYNEMLEMMRRGLRDPSTKERLQELVEVPTPPARDLLLKEKPYAAITKAIRKKYGMPSPKSARAEAGREQRETAQRQGSSEAEEELSSVDARKSIPQPTIRAPAEPPQRAPSPGRVGAPTVARRGLSPSGRSASPSLPSRATPGSTRVASPVRVAREGTSGIPPPRAASPLSRARPASKYYQERVTVSTANRSPEYGIAKSKPDANAGQVPPTQGTTDRPQQRVSILQAHLTAPVMPEAPSPLAQFMQSHKPNSISERSDTTQPPPALNKLAAFVESHQPNNVSGHTSAPKSDPTSTGSTAFAKFMKTQPPNGYFQKQPPLSDPPAHDELDGVRGQPLSHHASRTTINGIAAPTSRFAAAALEFVSHDHGGHSINDRPPQPSASAPDDKQAFGGPSYHSIDRSTRTAIGVQPGRSNDVDEFLARPIPVSMPAPEPRASANVTERGRRPDAEETTANTHETAEVRKQSTFQFVQATSQNGPVPHPSNHDEYPAGARIDSTSVSEMTSNLEDAPVATSNPLEAHDGAEFEQDSDKENSESQQLSDGPNSHIVAQEKPDALASLGAIRAGLKAHLEPPTSSHVVKVPRSTESSSVASQETPSIEVTSAANVARIDPAITELPRVHVNPADAGRTSIKLPPSLGVHREIDPPQTAGIFSRHQNHHKDTGAVQGLLKTPVAPIGPDVQNDNNSASTEVKADQEAPPAVDFVRERASFTFANPPRQPGSVTHNFQPQREQDGGQREELPVAQAAHTGVYPETPQAQPTDRTHFVPQFREHSTPSDERMRPSRPNRGDNSNETAAPRRQGHSHPFSLNQGFPPPPPQSVERREQPPRQEQPNLTNAPNTNLGNETTQTKRQQLLQPKPERTQSGIATKMVYSFCLVLGAIFAISGLIQAATKVRDAYEYHNALLSRINQFEASIVESYESVRKMDEKYAVWSDYVRELAEQDESNALHQLESIQLEVEKWQTEMKNDLLAFKQSLSGDIIDAALAPLREPNTTATDGPAP